MISHQSELNGTHTRAQCESLMTHKASNPLRHTTAVLHTHSSIKCRFHTNLSTTSAWACWGTEAGGGAMHDADWNQTIP